MEGERSAETDRALRRGKAGSGSVGSSSRRAVRLDRDRVSRGGLFIGVGFFVGLGGLFERRRAVLERAEREERRKRRAVLERAGREERRRRRAVRVKRSERTGQGRERSWLLFLDPRTTVEI